MIPHQQHKIDVKCIIALLPKEKKKKKKLSTENCIFGKMCFKDEGKIKACP